MAGDGEYIICYRDTSKDTTVSIPDTTKPKFDEKIIESDLSLIRNFTETGMLFLGEGGGHITAWQQFSSGSSPSISVQYGVWYDTANNLIKYTGDSGNTWISGFSFPLCTYTANATSGFTSINQVFDWIGRIGSSVFLLPGVKGLCPYEFNPDGTYKNIEFEVDKVEVRTNNRNAVDGILLYQPTMADKFLFWHEGVYVSYAESNPKTNWTRWYNRKENKWYYLGDDGTELNDLPMCVLATEVNAPSTAPYNITSLTPRAVQTNNTARKIGDVYFCPGKTNCLTSFPKNVNLTLSNGQVTLKAGSKVYIPNGWTEYTYYKCTTTSWTQPTLSADGTVGGTSYACRCKAYLTDYPAYKAFDSDKSSTMWASATNAVDNWIEFYSPVELIVSKVSITNRKENIPGTFGKVTLQGSLNGTDYYDLAVYSNTNSSASATWSFNTSVQRPAKYLRLYANSQYGSNGDIVVAHISFTAQQVTATVESTADDYTYVVGSGERVFEEKIIESDLSCKNGNTNTTSLPGMIYVREGGSSMGYGVTTNTFSGATNPASAWAIWYDLPNNIIWRYGADTTTTLYKCSLPIGICPYMNSAFTSINQTFDWVGFIGGHVFTLPNIDGLISNGFNLDGTYKNIDSKVTSVQIIETPKDESYYLILGDRGFGNSPNNVTYNFKVRENSSSDAWGFKYDTKTNKHIGIGSENLDKQLYFTNIASFVKQGGIITSLTPRAAQTTNDLRRIKETYNGSTLVRGYISNATIFEKSAAGTYTVTIPYNGYYQLWLVGAGGGGMFNSSGNKGSSAAGNSGGYVNVKAYLKKGSYTVTVGAGGTAKGGLDWTGWGNNGGNTSITFDGKTLLLAGGGTANKVSYPSGYQQNGTISTANQINSSNFTLVQTVSNLAGNKGGLGGNGSSPTGGASRYGGYGKGGNVYNRNSADAGGNGYVKVVAI